MNSNSKIDAHLACVRDGNGPEKFYFLDKKTNTLLDEIKDVSQFDKKTVSITYFKNNKIQFLYTGQVNGKCRPNGVGKAKGKNWEYEGDWKNGQPDGQGTRIDYKEEVCSLRKDDRENGLEVKKIIKYVTKCGWKDGKNHGKGIQYKIEPFYGYNDIEVIAEGEWKKGKFWNGKGKLKEGNSSSYIGDFKEGKPHGIGVKTLNSFEGRLAEKWIPESKYSCRWREGEKYGEGAINYLLSGNKFLGKWDDKGYAEGTLFYKKKDPDKKNGDIYTGRLRGDFPNGKGTMIYENGDKYVGNFERKFFSKNQQGCRHGFGTMTYKNGDKYEGFWNYDNKQGKGKMTYKNGDVYEGFWKNDKKQGVGKFTSKKLGTIYEGDWLDGWINGHGKITDKEGNSKTVLFEKGGLEEIEKTIPIQCDNIVEQDNKSIENNVNQSKENINKEKEKDNNKNI